MTSNSLYNAWLLHSILLILIFYTLHLLLNSYANWISCGPSFYLNSTFSIWSSRTIMYLPSHVIIKFCCFLLIYFSTLLPSFCVPPLSTFIVLDIEATRDLDLVFNFANTLSNCSYPFSTLFMMDSVWRPIPRIWFKGYSRESLDLIRANSFSTCIILLPSSPSRL